jgi:hypothetical protein
VKITVALIPASKGKTAKRVHLDIGRKQIAAAFHFSAFQEVFTGNSFAGELTEMIGKGDDDRIGLSLFYAPLQFLKA